MNSTGGFTIDRRTLLGSAAMGLVSGLSSGLIMPGRARAATSVQFQTSAGARFGTPNAVLIKDFNTENPDIQVVMDTVEPTGPPIGRPSGAQKVRGGLRGGATVKCAYPGVNLGSQTCDLASPTRWTARAV